MRTRYDAAFELGLDARKSEERHDQAKHSHTGDAPGREDGRTAGTMRRLVAGQGEHAAADDERDDGGDQTKKPQAAVHVGDAPLEGAPSSCKAGARRREDASVRGAVGSGRCGERALITSPYFCRNCLPHDAWRDARPRFLLRASGETTPDDRAAPSNGDEPKGFVGKLKTCRMSPHAASRAGIACGRLRLRLHTHGIPCTVSAASRRVPKASQASAPPA